MESGFANPNGSYTDPDSLSDNTKKPDSFSENNATSTTADTSNPSDSSLADTENISPQTKLNTEPADSNDPTRTHTKTQDKKQVITRETINPAAVVIGVIFVLIGILAILVASGVSVSLWSIVIVILGTAGLALLITAIITARKD